MLNVYSRLQTFANGYKLGVWSRANSNGTQIYNEMSLRMYEYVDFSHLFCFNQMGLRMYE